MKRINVALSPQDCAVIIDSKQIKWYAAGVATNNKAAVLNLVKAGEPMQKLN